MCYALLRVRAGVGGTQGSKNVRRWGGGELICHAQVRGCVHTFISLCVFVFPNFLKNVFTDPVYFSSVFHDDIDKLLMQT